MLVKKCDRCGNIFSRDDSEQAPIREHQAFNAMAIGNRKYGTIGNGFCMTEQFDLCPTCQKSLISWLEVLRYGK